MIDQFRVLLARLRAEDAAMTPGPWVNETTDYQPLGYPRALIHFGDGFKFNDVIAPNVTSRDSAGIAALRNRNARLLDLLEALVEERRWNSAVDRNVTGSLDAYLAAAQRTDAALTALVEAEQEVPRG